MQILLHNQDYLGVKEHSTAVHKITKITTLRDILACLLFVCKSCRFVLNMKILLHNQDYLGVNEIFYCCAQNI